MSHDESPFIYIDSQWAVINFLSFTFNMQFLAAHYHKKLITISLPCLPKDTAQTVHNDIVKFIMSLGVKWYVQKHEVQFLKCRVFLLRTVTRAHRQHKHCNRKKKVVSRQTGKTAHAVLPSLLMHAFTLLLGKYHWH